VLFALHRASCLQPLRVSEDFERLIVYSQRFSSCFGGKYERRLFGVTRANRSTAAFAPTEQVQQATERQPGLVVIYLTLADCRLACSQRVSKAMPNGVSREVGHPAATTWRSIL
jgi:hypothetical protein